MGYSYYQAKRTTLPVLIDRVTARSKHKCGHFRNRPAIEYAINDFVDEIRQALLNGEEVEIFKLCTFKPYISGKRAKHDFQTGEVKALKPKLRIKTIWRKPFIKELNEKNDAELMYFLKDL